MTIYFYPHFSNKQAIYTHLSMTNHFGLEIFNGPDDFPIAYIFEYSNWLFEHEEHDIDKTNLNTEDDKMMFLLYNKFKKYAKYTLKDIRELNVKQEFDSMFSKEMIADVLLNNNWKHEPK